MSELTFDDNYLREYIWMHFFDGDDLLWAGMIPINVLTVVYWIELTNINPCYKEKKNIQTYECNWCIMF